MGVPALRLGAWLGVVLLALGCVSERGALVPPPLAGSSWIAESVDSEGMVGRPPITLSFESAERATGSAGCNRYFATVRMTSISHVRFSDVGSTRMACPSEVMEREQRYLAALGSVRSYRLDGQALVLLDDKFLARVPLIRPPRGS